MFLLELNYQDAAVQSALISAIGGILTSTIAAICAAVIGKQITGRQKLREQLATAQADIAFLLRVEALHGEIHAQVHKRTYKITVRDRVRAHGLMWSGRFTPGRVSALSDDEVLSLKRSADAGEA